MKHLRIVLKILLFFSFIYMEAGCSSSSSSGGSASDFPTTNVQCNGASCVQ